MRFPRLFKEETDFVRSIKSGVVNSDLVFHNTQAISSYNHLYWKCLSLTSDKLIYIFHAYLTGRAGKDAKKNPRKGRKGKSLNHAISTLITCLREALGGFACPSGQAGVKRL